MEAIINRFKMNSISQKLLFSLSFLSLLAIMSLIFAYSSYKKIDNNYQTLAEDSLPEILLANSLSQKNAELSLQTLKILNASTKEDVKEIKQNIDEINSFLLLKITEIKNFGIENNEILDITQQISKNTEEQIRLLEQNINLSPKIQHLQKETQKQIKSIQVETKHLVTQVNTDLFNNQFKERVALKTSVTLTEFQFNLSIISNILRRTLELKNSKTVLKEKSLFTEKIKLLTTNLFRLPQYERKILARHIAALLVFTKGETDIFSTATNLLNTKEKIATIGEKNSRLTTELNKKLYEFTNSAKDVVNQDIIKAKEYRFISQLILLALVFLSVLSNIAIIGLYIKPYIINRIKNLTEKTRQIANGNLSTEVNTEGQDEISDISKALENFRLALIEKKSNDISLKESRGFLELMMDNNPNLVFVKDEEFRIIEANSAFINAYPKDMQDKIIGYTTIEEYEKEEAESFLADDKKAFSTGYADTLESIKFPNNQTKVLNTQKIRFKNTSGKSFILGISTDVTEREALISKLQASNEELEHFAYISSHDLQEPLRMVTNFTKLLQSKYSDQLDDTAKEYIDISCKAATNMQNLINDLLEYARTSNGDHIKEPVNTQKMLGFVKENLALDIDKLSAIITDENLPIIQGNPVQFSRLLQNLISNSLKYRKENIAPEIHIKASEREKDWLFSVEDNGIGMQTEYCDQIFKPFKRLHGKASYGGTGIGLAICQKIIESLGGRIWAESTINKGSIFYFTISKDL